MKVVAVYNLKGGVGKTTIVSNLAWLAAERGRRTLLWDLDPQGAASFYLRGPEEMAAKVRKVWAGKVGLNTVIEDTAWPGLSLVPADFALRHTDLRLEDTSEKRLAKLLKPLANSFDLVLLDCPPSLSRLAEAVLRVADAVILPVLPSWLSLRAFEQVLAFCVAEDLDITRLWPVLSMVDRRRSLHRDWLYQPPPVLAARLRTYLPYSAAAERMGEHRDAVHRYAGSDPAGRAFPALYSELERRLWPAAG